EGLELMRNNYPIMEPFGIQTANDFTPATTLAQGLPAIAPVTIPTSGILDLPLDVGFEGQPKNLHRGYIQSWNLTLQKEIGWGFTGEAGYVGTRSIRQLGFIDINAGQTPFTEDRKSTRLNSSHSQISYAVFCRKKKTIEHSRASRQNWLYFAARQIFDLHPDREQLRKRRAELDSARGICHISAKGTGVYSAAQI